MNFLKIVILFGSFLCTQLAVADEKSDSIGETGACWDSMGVIKQCQDLHFRAGRQD